MHNGIQYYDCSFCLKYPPPSSATKILLSLQGPVKEVSSPFQSLFLNIDHFDSKQDLVHLTSISLNVGCYIRVCVFYDLILEDKISEGAMRTNKTWPLWGRACILVTVSTKLINFWIQDLQIKGQGIPREREWEPPGEPFKITEAIPRDPDVAGGVEGQDLWIFKNLKWF